MQKLHFSIQIAAPKEKVWDTMLEDATYRIWTSAFNAGSYYKGDWSKGSTIEFLGPDSKTSEASGMLGTIKENKLHEFISIEYIGLVQKGLADTESEEAKKWSSAHENYTFIEKGAVTEVMVDIDVEDEYIESFNTMWPKALHILKELSEK